MLSKLLYAEDYTSILPLTRPTLASVVGSSSSQALRFDNKKVAVELAAVDIEVLGALGHCEARVLYNAQVSSTDCLV